MTPVAAAILAVLLLAAALPAPASAAGIALTTEGISTSTPAPMPDPDANDPAGLHDAAPAASLRPGVTRPSLGPTTPSQGYTPGSSYDSAFDNRFRPLPTLNLSVKLQ